MTIEKTQVRQLKKRKFKKLSYLALPKRLFIDNKSLISAFLRFQTFVFCEGVACIWELAVIVKDDTTILQTSKYQYGRL